jgi:3-oxoacyl-[acyl-carrier protein] reductase
MESLRLAGKRGLVTGSSQGMGAEMAKLSAKEGATVVLSHRQGQTHVEPVLESIRRSGGKAVVVHCDVSDPSSVTSMFGEIKAKVGGLDFLVNNAGHSDDRLWNLSLADTNLEMWHRVFAVDAFGTFLCTQAAAKLMKKGSSIVNVASTPALVGDTAGLVYASAKGAVVSMTRMLAKMLAPKIRVNCMAFGSFDTVWVNWLDSAEVESYRKAIPLKRFGKPIEAARLALYLASEESSFMTGQVLVIDGGEALR